MKRGRKSKAQTPVSTGAGFARGQPSAEALGHLSTVGRCESKDTHRYTPTDPSPYQSKILLGKIRGSLRVGFPPSLAFEIRNTRSSVRFGAEKTARDPFCSFERDGVTKRVSDTSLTPVCVGKFNCNSREWTRKADASHRCEHVARGHAPEALGKVSRSPICRHCGAFQRTQSPRVSRDSPNTQTPVRISREPRTLSQNPCSRRRPHGSHSSEEDKRIYIYIYIL